MKKICTYYLLLLYAASVCKPFAIWFFDTLSHVYFSHQHIATVHRHGGKNHVHQQIGKTAKEETPLQKQSGAKAHDDISCTAIISCLFNFNQPPTSITQHHYSDDLPAVFLAVQIPPPWPQPAIV